MSEKSAEYINEILEQYNLSKAEMARLTGVTRLSIYKYSLGHNIHPKTAIKMVSKFMNTRGAILSLERLIT